MTDKTNSGDQTEKNSPLSLKSYRLATGLMKPVADFALRQRLKKGKEDPKRVDERKGRASLPRPDGPLVWIHGASVGESLSVLPLVARLSDMLPGTAFLVTTGTVTSARLMADRLPAAAFHQFAPLDQPDFITSFLDHWQPDAAILVESELWPNLISQTRARRVPMALVNGRISPKSFENWQQRPAAIGELLSAFSVILAQDNLNAERFSSLSGRDVPMLGNLKLAAPDLPADPEELRALETMFAGRPLWLAASTHPGEEEDVLCAHEKVREHFPDLLTVLVPRHPDRRDEIGMLIEGASIPFATRSKSEPVTGKTGLYLADTLGELGLFYRLSNIAFVGGSITETGGHNPLEPARLGAAILYGPHIFNFAETYREMRASGGTALVRNGDDLAAALIRLLTDDFTCKAMAERAESWSRDSAEEVLAAITDALQPVLPRVAGSAALAEPKAG